MIIGAGRGGYFEIAFFWIYRACFALGIYASAVTVITPETRTGFQGTVNLAVLRK